MDKYNIIITPNAENQIKEIVNYISTILLNPNAARKFVIFLKEKISKLNIFPEAYPILDRKPWNKKEIRKILIKSFVVYFYVNKEKYIIYILAVVYGKRDQLKQLEFLDFND